MVYFVNGIRFATDNPKATVRDLLRQVDESPGHFYLERNDVEFPDPDMKVDIREGDRFVTKPRSSAPHGRDSIHYKVNGEEQTTFQATLTVEQILRSAGRSASIDISQISDYFLQNIEDGKKYEEWAEVVSIHPGDQFLAVHRGRTPVAWIH